MDFLDACLCQFRNNSTGTELTWTAAGTAAPILISSDEDFPVGEALLIRQGEPLRPGKDTERVSGYLSLSNGDQVLLFEDGLGDCPGKRLFNDKALRQIIIDGLPSMEKLTESVGKAYEKGLPDDVVAIVVSVSGGS